MTISAYGQREQKTVRFEAGGHQLRALSSDADLIFMGCGVGAGKTHSGSFWTIARAKEAPPDVLGLIAANTYTQLFDSTLRNLFKNWSSLGLVYRPQKIPRAHGPFSIQLWQGSHWHEIICRSLKDYEMLSGTEVGYYWMDEVWQTPELAWDLVTERCRDTRMPHNRGLLTTTLDEPGSWMHKQFVQERGDITGQGKARHWDWTSAVSEVDGEMLTDLVIYARTMANARNLPPSYVPRMRKRFSDKLFERKVLAKWVSLETGQIYYAFDRMLHMDASVKYDPALPILWTLDFNIGQGKPMSSLVCQIGKGIGPDGEVRPELRVLDELVLESTDTNDAVAEFKQRWGNKAERSGVRIYGDASGKASDTRSKTSDYGIIRDAGFDDQLVPESNPPLRTRHNDVNSLLKNADGDVRVRIHPRCKVLPTGLEVVKTRTGAQYLEEERYEQHVTTALGYLICVEFPTEEWEAGSVEALM